MKKIITAIAVLVSLSASAQKFTNKWEGSQAWAKSVSPKFYSYLHLENKWEGSEVWAKRVSLQWVASQQARPYLSEYEVQRLRFMMYHPIHNYQNISRD